jgi:uncharacterized metal-binding protein
VQNKIRIKHLKGSSLFKLISIGNIIFFVPFSIITGISTYFGIGKAIITWKGKPLTGIAGLVASPFFGLFVGLVISAFLWVAIFVGLWIYTKFKPLELEFIPFSQADNDKSTDYIRDGN